VQNSTSFDTPNFEEIFFNFQLSTFFGGKKVKPFNISKKRFFSTRISRPDQKHMKHKEFIKKGQNHWTLLSSAPPCLPPPSVSEVQKPWLTFPFTSFFPTREWERAKGPSIKVFIYCFTDLSQTLVFLCSQHRQNICGNVPFCGIFYFNQ
jgi:hypothetical protein